MLTKLLSFSRGAAFSPINRWCRQEGGRHNSPSRSVSGRPYFSFPRPVPNNGFNSDAGFARAG